MSDFKRPTPEQVETSLLNIGAGKVQRSIPARATDDDVVLDAEITALRADLDDARASLYFERKASAGHMGRADLLAERARRAEDRCDAALSECARLRAELLSAREALRELVDQFASPAAMQGWANVGPCPCYDDEDAANCVCSEESRRISLATALDNARRALSPSPKGTPTTEPPAGTPNGEGA